MRVSPVHIDLRKKWKGHSEVHLTDILHRLITLRLLTQELVAREAENHEVIVRIGIPEGFELLELWSESTLGGSIDDEENFSFIL